MVIHEYQGKALFRAAGVPLPSGDVAETPEQAAEIARKIGKKVAVKAQVLVGGRGKAGGIKLADTPEEAQARAKEILGMDIKGLKVHKVLVEEAIDIDKEFYLGFVLDRSNNRHLLMFSPVGGIDIEEVAEKTPDQIYKYGMHPLLGLQSFQTRDLIHRVPGLDQGTRKQLGQMVELLWKMYSKYDGTLVEINPLAVLKDGRLVAADAKFNADDNAIFRQPELEKMEEGASDDPIEQAAKAKNLAYVRLDGDVGIIGNGAGLVMTTLDMVNREGGRPANFLDVGGGANAKVVRNSLETVLMDKNVKGVFFNIFGGITRGDEVAKGMIEATKEMDLNVPIVVRLSGTRAEEGRALLEGSRFVPAETMSEGAAKIVELTGGKSK
jgi:succinyl-CoA synthetase beta subunit